MGILFVEAFILFKFRQIDRQIDGLMDRCLDRQIDRYIQIDDRRLNRLLDTWLNSLLERQIDIQSCRYSIPRVQKIVSQKDRKQINSQKDRKIDRQIDRQKRDRKIDFTYQLLIFIFHIQSCSYTIPSVQKCSSLP